MFVKPKVGREVRAKGTEERALSVALCAGYCDKKQGRVDRNKPCLVCA